MVTTAFLEFLEIFPGYLKLANSNAQTNDVTFVMSGSLEKHKICDWITIYTDQILASQCLARVHFADYINLHTFTCFTQYFGVRAHILFRKA